MIRTAFALFVTTWALALGSGYALTLVYPAVEAAAVAFMLGVAWAMGFVTTWRSFRRLMR